MLNSEKTSWLNPANRKSTLERISFGSKPVGPKVAKLNFGTWLNKSCATRTRGRRHAPLTHCNAAERPTVLRAHAGRWPAPRSAANRSSRMANRTWAASMAVRRACPSLRIEAQRSRASFATRGDRNCQRTRRVLNTSAGKIGAMIRLVIRNSDSPFRRRAISSCTHKSSLIGAA